MTERAEPIDVGDTLADVVAAKHRELIFHAARAMKIQLTFPTGHLLVCRGLPPAHS